jgi:hypothetical protein
MFASNDLAIAGKQMTDSISKRRNAMTIAAIVTAVLMTRPLAVLAAGTQRKSVHRRSDVAASSTVPHADPTFLEILRHQMNRPPPPLPGEGSSSDWSWNKPASNFANWRNMDGFEAEGPCAERVLKLPQVLSLHHSLVLTRNREHRANRSRGVD